MKDSPSRSIPVSSAEQAKPYSHIRRKALEQVALMLDPTWFPAARTDGADARPAVQEQAVTTQTTAQPDNPRLQVINSIGETMVRGTGFEPVVPGV